MQTWTCPGCMHVLSTHSPFPRQHGVIAGCELPPWATVAAQIDGGVPRREKEKAMAKNSFDDQSSFFDRLEYDSVFGVADDEQESLRRQNKRAVAVAHRHVQKIAPLPGVLQFGNRSTVAESPTNRRSDLVVLFDRSFTLAAGTQQRQQWQVPDRRVSGPYRISVSTSDPDGASVSLVDFTIGQHRLVTGAVHKWLLRETRFEGPDALPGTTIAFDVRNESCCFQSVCVVVEGYRPDSNHEVARSKADVDALEAEIRRIDEEYRRECQAIDREFEARERKAKAIAHLGRKNLGASNVVDRSIAEFTGPPSVAGRLAHELPRLEPCAVCQRPTGGCCPLGPDRTTFERERPYEAGRAVAVALMRERDCAATTEHLARRDEPFDAADDAAWESPCDEYP